MTSRYKRSLLTAAAVGALSVSALAAPAFADAENGTNYPADVATESVATVLQFAGRTKQFRGKVSATGVVAGVHGRFGWNLFNAKSGRLAASRGAAVSGPSGTIVSSGQFTLGGAVGLRTYFLTGRFTALDGHHEKSSFTQKFVNLR